MTRRGVAAAFAVVLAAAGCGSEAKPEPEPAVRAAWSELTLPMPAGAAGRFLPRAVAACDGKWYIVGATAGADGATQPAAWVSTDTQTWTALTIHADSYYGKQNVIYTAGCREGRLAAVGGKVGGAHGNPRVSTWHQQPDGSLIEVKARFELYGGPVAINVSRMAAGPKGWMITGNRYSGAAVWTSADSAKFEILEDAPELSSDDRGETWAADVVAVPDGWLVAGGIILSGRTDRDPMAWRSADGVSWQRTAAPGEAEYDEFQRAAVSGDGTAYAVGLRGLKFGAWRLEGDKWQARARFGASSGRGVLSVSGLTATGEQLVASVSDGARYVLWLSPDGGASWRVVEAPAAMPSGASQAVSVFAADGRLLLLADDGQAGRVWRSATPLPG